MSEPPSEFTFRRAAHLMSAKYMLVGKKVKPVHDLMAWAKWFETADRRVAQDIIDEVRISTVFLGLDHQFGNGAPLLFETMVFRDDKGDECERCETWEEAIEQHARMVEMVRGSLNVAGGQRE